MFAPVASAMNAIHRYCLVLVSNAQWPEIQPLVPGGQIVSANLQLLTEHGHTTIILI